MMSAPSSFVNFRNRRICLSELLTTCALEAAFKDSTSLSNASTSDCVKSNWRRFFVLID